jgi:RimJ/RimL family protein N-acetyltransferase
LTSRPPERIEAEGIVLRRPREDDEDALAAAIAASLEHLRPWMAWADDGATMPERRAGHRESVARGWADGSDFAFLVLDPEERTVVGAAGLHRRIGPRAIEIGYWVHVDHLRRGVATAVAGALTDAALALPDVDRVEIHCDEANVRSAAVPQRLGYRLDRIEDDEVTAPAETGRSMVWVRAGEPGGSTH